MSSPIVDAAPAFCELGLSVPVLAAVEAAGYETPTPIQREVIPQILAARDVVGQAQTGTGKTAAFALPILTRLGGGRAKKPQVLVLAPTRELALQVAESFSELGRQLKRLQVAAVFGGQDYGIQIRQLQQGAQVVVGTPGRVMDHLRKGTLDASSIHTLVLDEADEMLKMGFLDDVEWIIQQLPAREQTALFSATMPPSIRAIAAKYLVEPAEVTIRAKTVSAQTINQRFLQTGGFGAKIEALTKILEVEDYEGVLVFVRTKVQSMELAEKLAGEGYSVAALNGDIEQSHRLRTVELLKAGKIDILVATDVAARGLDVDRISHVINFDIPFDTEAYIHRIGRTGRAGRSGEAILFVTGREKSMLKAIEKATRQKISPMNLPSPRDINRKRIADFKRSITSSLNDDLSLYEALLTDYQAETGIEPLRLAAALASLSRRGKAEFLSEEKVAAEEKLMDKSRQRKARAVGQEESGSNGLRETAVVPVENGMERYRIELGHNDGIRPANIVGAIANEAAIDARHIGRVSILDTFSTVDLPYGMPFKVLKVLQRARIYGKMLKMQKIESGAAEGGSKQKARKPVKPKSKATAGGRTVCSANKRTQSRI